MVFFSRLKKGTLKVCEHSIKQKNPMLCADPLLETDVLSLFLLTYTHLDSQQIFLLVKKEDVKVLLTLTLLICTSIYHGTALIQSPNDNAPNIGNTFYLPLD